ncbi:MAG: efflux RND transporter periplasmic adaptor subunit [Pirellulaceae bacterium]|nr:efflux RND transporter periplasmic adaptor subunit [Pirellulaceae bacterium]
MCKFPNVKMLVGLLIGCSLFQFSIANAQPTKGLTREEAKILEEAVNNTVREYGVIESASSVEIRSPIAGTIIYLVNDGTRVSKGDRIIALDSSVIKEKADLQKIKLAATKTERLAAENDFRRCELALSNGITLGEKKVQFAKMKLDLLQGEGGEHQTLSENHREKIQVAEKQVAFYTDAIADTQKSLQSGAGNTIALRKYELDLFAARAEIKSLRRTEALLEQKHLVKIAELELQSSEQKSEVAMATLELQSELEQSEKKLQAADLAVETEQEKLAALVKKIASTVLFAPQDGVVVFPTNSARRSRAAIMEIGVAVGQRQPILKIADIENFQVAVNVHETMIRRIQIGQTASVRLDASPDRILQGKVLRINNTPEIPVFSQESVKKYKVMISVTNPQQELKIGLTAMVEIKAPRKTPGGGR